MCEKSICQVDCGINGHCDADTKNASALTDTAAWGARHLKLQVVRKASADDDSKSNGKDSDDSKTQNSKKALKVRVRNDSREYLQNLCHFEVILAPQPVVTTVGSKYKLSKEVDAAQYATKCNIDCTKKCLKN